jgi:hypothetical protein
MFSLLLSDLYLVYIMFAKHNVYTLFVLGLHYDCKYTHSGMLVAFPRIQTKWIHPLTCCFASLACHRLLSASFPVLGGPACDPKSKDVNRVWTWCKPKCMVYMEMGSMWRYVNLEVPSVFATGCDRSDLTTCIPVTWVGWGPLVRFEQAVFRVLNFEQISVLPRVATVVPPARGIWTGSYLTHSSFDARSTWHVSVSWTQTIFFGCLVRQRWPHFPLFQSLGKG